MSKKDRNILLKDILESIQKIKKYTEGMNFENYGKWHIDHIIPLSSAGNDLDRIKELCHYSNLQPLWAIDNIKKGNKIL